MRQVIKATVKLFLLFVLCAALLVGLLWLHEQTYQEELAHDITNSQ